MEENSKFLDLFDKLHVNKLVFNVKMVLSAE